MVAVVDDEDDIEDDDVDDDIEDEGDDDDEDDRSLATWASRTPRRYAATFES